MHGHVYGFAQYDPFKLKEFILGVRITIQYFELKYHKIFKYELSSPIGQTKHYQKTL